MLKLFTLWAGLILLLSSDVFSQSVRRKKNIATILDTVQIDTLSIVPGTVSLIAVDSALISPQHYKIDFGKAKLIWISKPLSDSVQIQYQTFPVLFTKRYSRRNSDEINAAVIDNSDQGKTESSPTDDNTIFSISGLNKSGSISRSIGVGNNQDLALNSNMTLQLSGKITEDLEILAAISDDNIPIQPEGNTQQINQFDKVFIQLKRKNSTLTGGDFEIQRPEGYFMNFYKRTQGASFATQSAESKSWQYKSYVSAAVAKGRSSRMLFTGTEGNQGPYRLNGNNGEQFIIVLSGTERVYVDGVLQIRGQENDYVIDYNTAEITFTARRLITQNSRIIVEFEYSDKNYARTLTHLNQEIGNKKMKFRFNFYNEQDNPNQPFLQDLRDDQKGFLKTIGNNVDQAFFANVDTVPFNENEILYKKIDTLGATDVYVFSTDRLAAKYRLGFTFVGVGKGNYRLNSTSTANGRVFEYVSPVTGIQQGDYEPVTLLITPKKQQLVTLGGDFKPTKGTVVSSEFAFSNNDVNLFSAIDNRENQGFAFKLLAKNEVRLSGNDSTATRLTSSVSYERTSDGFKAIERYRDVEFERDFNLFGLTQTESEHLASFNLGVFKNQNKNVNYRFSTFIRENVYAGYQNGLEAKYSFGNLNLAYFGRILNANSDINRTTFLRQKADLNKKIKGVILGMNFEQETNQTKQEDQLLGGTSFAFSQYKAYINSAISNGNSFKAEISRRYDKLPDSIRLENYSVADVLTGGIELAKKPNSILTISSTYRNLRYRNPLIRENESTLLGRIDYNLNIFKGFVNTSIFYELGPGREPKREFSYLEVVTGQGTYTWNDYNNNNIKELNEFEIARYRDQARYIRVFQPTNQFVNTDYTTVNYTLRLTPSSILKDRTGFYKVLSRFSSQTAFKTERKATGGEGIASYNPFSRITDERLISDNSFFRNTVFFNRNHPDYGLDFNYQSSGNKILLINGFDTRGRNEAGLRLRWNIRKNSFGLETKKGWKKYESELFDERNYRIRFYELLPEFNYLFNNNFRLGFSGSFRKQNNLVEETGGNATNLRLGSEARYTILRKGTITSAINLVKNRFSGEANTPVAYEMLEGLQVGNNLVWSCNLQRTIAKGVQMGLSYEGRKSAEVQTIHTGSVQFRAFF